MFKFKKISGVFLIISILISFFYFCAMQIFDCHHINDSASSYLTGTELSEVLEASTSIQSNNLTAKKGYHLHINLDEHMMYVYKDGELIKTYPVSGGKSTTPSPTGNWKIISKDTWGEGFGGAWLGFNVPWGKYGIHGTVEPWSVGKSNTSKGCIRMKNKDVRELYKMIPHGTTVTIVYEGRPFRAMKSGDVGSDVREMQLALKTLGYFNGYADGKFGAILKKSVQKFQKDNKLYPSGVINKQTYNLIIEKAKAKEEEKRLEEEQKKLQEQQEQSQGQQQTPQDNSNQQTQTKQPSNVQQSTQEGSNQQSSTIQ